jgi:methylglutaconyl-CoA hydratase
MTGRAIDDALIADTADRIALCRTSADGLEGVRSFLDKRKSRWAMEFEAERAAAECDDEEM